MAITQPYSGSLTVSTTELSLVSASSTLSSVATPGIYQLALDLSALAAGDQFTLKIKEKVQATGTQAVVDSVTFSGVQATPVYIAASLLLMNGWDFTLTKNAGTDRAIPYSIRMVG